MHRRDILFLLGDVTQRGLLVTDVSGQLIGPVFARVAQSNKNLETDVSGKHIGHIFKAQAIQ
jgi:hypothetical protein